MYAFRYGIDVIESVNPRLDRDRATRIRETADGPVALLGEETAE
jgi:hypothetical protein